MGLFVGFVLMVSLVGALDFAFMGLEKIDQMASSYWVKFLGLAYVVKTISTLASFILNVIKVSKKKLFYVLSEFLYV